MWVQAYVAKALVVGGWGPKTNFANKFTLTDGEFADKPLKFTSFPGAPSFPRHHEPVRVHKEDDKLSTIFSVNIS